MEDRSKKTYKRVLLAVLLIGAILFGLAGIPSPTQQQLETVQQMPNALAPAAVQTVTEPVEQPDFLLATLTVDGEQTLRGVRRGSTVRELLAMCGQTYNTRDRLSCDVDAPVTNGMQITLENTYTVTLCAFGTRRLYFMRPGTVADVLRAAGISLTEEMECSAAPETELTDNMEISVCRVRCEMEVRTGEIPFETEYINDAALYTGQKITYTAGKNGTYREVICRKYCDGVLTQEEVRSYAVTKEPRKALVHVGTRVYAEEVTSRVEIQPDGTQFSYRKRMVGMGTAYANDPITATGVPCQVGIVAVDPKIIPYGTKLYIRSTDGKYVYGYCVAGDTGGAALAGQILVDLFYNTEEECVQFGRREVEVFILE